MGRSYLVGELQVNFSLVMETLLQLSPGFSQSSVKGQFHRKFHFYVNKLSIFSVFCYIHSSCIFGASPLLLQGQRTLRQLGEVLGVFFFNLYPETEKQMTAQKTTGSFSVP